MLAGTAAHFLQAELRGYLRRGVTTIRVTGSQGLAPQEARQAMRYGAFRGPRVLTCGRIVSATAPGGRFYGDMYREADGPDDMRRAVREQIRAGADFIKVMTTGARSNELEDPEPLQVTEAELSAVAGEARRMGYLLSAHAEGLAGCAAAIAHGAHTIEHGMYLARRPDLLDAMAASGQVLVPTLSGYYEMAGLGDAVDEPDAPCVPLMPPALTALARRNLDEGAATMRAARQAGVKIAAGSDIPAGTGLEIARMIRHGLTPSQALVAATKTAAEALGLAGHLGTVAEGRLADLLVVDGDPLAEPGLLSDAARIWLVLQLGVPAAGQALETTAFAAQPVRPLTWDASSSRRTLTITSDRRSIRDLRELNEEAGQYFAWRYAGLHDLFGDSVRWDVDRLIKFPELARSWRASKNPKSKPSDSQARTALQVKFTVTLDSESSGRITEQASVQFIWKYDPKWISSGMVADWERLANCPLAICRATRERMSSKGAVQSVDLRDVRTLMAAYGRERGSLIRVVRGTNGNDLARIWQDNLRQAHDMSLISDSSARRLADLFAEFERRYDQAVRGFAARGLACQELEPQVMAYGSLLDAVRGEATTDRTRQMLLRPLLDIGTVAIDGGQASAIVAPWHPLRMAGMGRKARRASDLVRQVLITPDIEFGDSDLLFRELADEFAHPFYPEVALGWHGNHPELLALTDTVADYTLHESPFATDVGADDTNENPTESASRITDIVRRYLTLHPHERANLSVILYNCDSSRLPLAVVDKLAALDQEEEDVRCHVMLRHRDPNRLSRLYEQIVDTPDSDGDGYVAGEATRGLHGEAPDRHIRSPGASARSARWMSQRHRLFPGRDCTPRAAGVVRRR